MAGACWTRGGVPKSCDCTPPAGAARYYAKVLREGEQIEAALRQHGSFTLADGVKQLIEALRDFVEP